MYLLVVKLEHRGLLLVIVLNGRETFEEGGISWMFGDSDRFGGRFRDDFGKVI